MDDIGHRVRTLARPLGGPQDLDPLLDLIGDARYVLLGEATHGTSEFYTWRAEISRRLIAERGFSFVAVEGDWPDCMRVNRYARGLPDSGSSASEVLHAFERWPTWMWANEETVSFVEWMRQHGGVGFYGLDVYSLWESLAEVLRYVREHDPEGVPAAVRAFECFERAGGDAESYGLRARFVRETCEDEVARLLADLRRRRPPGAGPEDRFDADQNALVLWNAERYYRAMVAGGPESWNLRDRHMVETLDRLLEHHGPRSKAIVWAHNTHIGDARATDMTADGMINIGQLVREAHASEGVVAVGFGTYAGAVTAGREWGGPIEEMRVPEGLAGSWEDELHRALGADALLPLRGVEDRDLLRRRGHRAIGVVYDPRRERGNYVPTSLPRRYDALLWLERTRALRPLHDVHVRLDGEPFETWPSGM